MKQPPKPLVKALDKVVRDIDVLIRSRYPLLYLITHEERRLEARLAGLAKAQKKPFYVWTATTGMQAGGDVSLGLSDTGVEDKSLVDPAEAVQRIRTQGETGIYLLKDFHPFLDDPHVVRRLRDACTDLQNSYKTILISAPTLNLPCELEKDVNIIDIPLPDFPELFEILKGVCDHVAAKDPNVVKLSADDARLLVRAAQGLTSTEAENVFAKAVVQDSVLDVRDVELVLAEKSQIVRKSGILEFYPSNYQMAQVGGLSNLKHWLEVRSEGYTDGAASFGLPAPKGMLLLGAPGTGKSLTAKAIASTWKMPLLRLDFGKIFSGIVGSSEENMRKALKIAEGVAPAVLWIDEIEKGLAGGGSGDSDGGAASRVLGTFLTWMQETTARCFVVATANKIEHLPPELLRQGRFDAIFFVDLPDEGSRAEIFSIQLQRRGRDPKAYDVPLLAKAAKGFSGAEIEFAVIEGLFDAFHAQRDVTTDDLLVSVKRIVPLSVTYEEELGRLRSWARTRARPAHGGGGSGSEKAA
jgi:ATP-dependent 26S proteasome regulatory subunit